jgi:hypothetical protein
MLNQIPSYRKIPIIFALLVVVTILITAGSASAVEKPRHGRDVLLNTYHRNMDQLHKSSFGIPVIVESYEKDDKVNVDVYGILEYSFSDVVKMLTVPANWRDIVFIHPNVKASSYREQPDSKLLTFYLGRKTYQPPEDARQITCRYRIIAQLPSYLDIMLKADKGPFGTSDHTMHFKALPLESGKTFVHVSYAYTDSAALRLATKVYFATLGRDKVGFTVTGTDSDGNPEYIGGPRGAVERSAVRYYFAILSFMNTLRYSDETRFKERISEWHDLTSRYRKQLFDLDKKTYIELKSREQKNQISLQQRITKEAP